MASVAVKQHLKKKVEGEGIVKEAGGGGGGSRRSLVKECDRHKDCGHYKLYCQLCCDAF